MYTFSIHSLCIDIIFTTRYNRLYQLSAVNRRATSISIGTISIGYSNINYIININCFFHLSAVDTFSNDGCASGTNRTLAGTARTSALRNKDVCGGKRVSARLVCLFVRLLNSRGAFASASRSVTPKNLRGRRKDRVKKSKEGNM